MKKEDAIKHYGSVQALADALKITRPAIYQWGELVPETKAWKLQALTDSKLTVDAKLYK